MGRHPLLRYIHLRWRFILILIRMNISAIIDCRLNTMRSLATYMQMLQSYYPHSYAFIASFVGEETHFSLSNAS